MSLGGVLCGGVFVCVSMGVCLGRGCGGIFGGGDVLWQRGVFCVGVGVGVFLVFFDVFFFPFLFIFGLFISFLFA